MDEIERQQLTYIANRMVDLKRCVSDIDSRLMYIARRKSRKRLEKLAGRENKQ